MSPGMWHCVAALVVPNILQKHGAVIFKDQAHEEYQMWEKGGDIYRVFHDFRTLLQQVIS